MTNYESYCRNLRYSP